MLTIQTNIASLTAQQNLQNNATSLNTSLQRLSSGLRINSAADDAAGLAISDRMTTQINGLTQASKNANDGISLAQTAGGALAQVTANLQSIRQLAVQSANATNSASDRVALDQAVQQDIAEINRIATQTSFNNRNVLDGTFGNATFQVGANVGQTISVGLNTSAKAGDIGSFVSAAGNTAQTVTNTATAGAAVLTGTAGTIGSGQGYGGVNGTAVVLNGAGLSNLTLNGTQVVSAVVGSAVGQTTDSAYATAAAINASGVAGVTASASTSLTFDPTVAPTGGIAAGAGNFLNISGVATGTTANATVGYTLSINGQTAISIAPTSTATTVTLTSAVQSINSVSSLTGVTAGVSNGKLQLTAADGRNINIAETYSGTGATGTVTGTNQAESVFSGTAAIAGGTAVAGATALAYRGQVNLSSSNAINITNGSAGAGGGSALIGQASNLLSPTNNLESQNVQSVAAANATIQSVDSALTAIDSLNSTFGAIQNRFQSAIASIGTATTNLSAARSRIQDADFAAETSNLTRAQILQQAGTSILAQANALPQGVLKLLQ